MSVATIHASQFGFVKSIDRSDWNSAGAYQGQYTGSNPRVGVMLFGDLFGVNWRAQAVSKIELQLTFSGAGRSSEKTISMYRGTKSGIEGTGESMIGSKIGDFKTNGTAYKSTRTITFSETSNPNVFIQLTAWLRSMTTNTLVIYRNETTTGSYTDNYLQITAAVMTVTYEIGGSTGTLSADTVDAGRPITLTVTPLETDGAVSHTVEWLFGTRSSGAAALPDGLTVTHTIPLDWLDQIPSSDRGTAYCRLTTLVDGAELSVQDIPFTLRAPISIIPRFTARITPEGTEGGYWQHIGGARIEIADASSQYGATIASYRIAGAEGVSGSDPVLVTAPFEQAGPHNYTLTVTDTRGRSVRKNASINVSALAPPSIIAFSVQRYAAKVDDSGEIVYTENLSGGHVWFTIDAEIDPAGGNNTPPAYILYGPAGSANRKRVDIPWPENASGITTSNDAGIITADIPLNSAYEFQLVVEDEYSSAAWTARVEKSSAIMHFAGTGYGVSIGGFSGGTMADKRFDVAPEWTSHFPGGAYGYGDYRMDRAGTTELLNITNPNFGPYNDRLTPRISRVGAQVYLEGFLRSLVALDSGNSSFNETVAVLPEWARPATDCSVISQGSGEAFFWLRINTDGTVAVARYRKGSSYADAAADTQWPLSSSWLAADAYMQTYSVSSTTIRCINENADASIREGSAYVARLTPELGTEITSISITMGGADATAFYEKNLIHIPAVTGDIVISAAAEETPAALIQITDDGNGNVSASEVIEGSLLHESGDGDVTIIKYATATVRDDGEGNIEIK